MIYVLGAEVVDVDSTVLLLNYLSNGPLYQFNLLSDCSGMRAS